MSGSNTFVFSAKRRGSNTPVVCKFFSDQESYRREMKFFERVHTGDFVPGQSYRLMASHAVAMCTRRYCICFLSSRTARNRSTCVRFAALN